MTGTYSNYAFISYSHRDMAVAKWLQRNLEQFKLPTKIHNEINAASRYLRPVFRDQSDLNTGILSNELRKHLENSKFLILICSKYSAQSQWVSDEARSFVEMGRLDRIIPVIIPDEGCNERDLFPIYLRELFEQHPDKELLGINFGDGGKDKALIRVVSRMLDVSFDSIWQRYQRQKRLRALSYSAASMAVAAIIYFFAIPITLQIEVQPQTSALPAPGNITLLVNGGEYSCPVATPQFDNIRLPGYKRFSDINIAAKAPFFEPVDTIIACGYGLRKQISLNLLRDDSFAIFKGSVLDDDMNPLPDVAVTIAGQSTSTDISGEFKIYLPIEQQRPEQPISLIKEGYGPIERDDETPGSNLKFIMHKN